MKSESLALTYFVYAIPSFNPISRVVFYGGLFSLRNPETYSPRVKTSWVAPTVEPVLVFENVVLAKSTREA